MFLCALVGLMFFFPFSAFQAHRLLDFVSSLLEHPRAKVCFFVFIFSHLLSLF